ncbi:MAG: fasciclin domain-containing protein [Stenotrophomonas sp.]
MKSYSRMRSLTVGLSLALATTALAPMAMAEKMGSTEMQRTVMVGGAAMSPTKNIIQNAMNSNDHTTLVAAIKAAGLVATLEGAGPFTVFAPTNEAFAALPAGTVENLLKPENKAALAKILTYHVVAGNYTSHDLAKLTKKHQGKAMLKTVQGDEITVADKDGKWTVTDAKGNVAHITIANVMQSNGVIFVIDKVLMP